jgi:hypothetical protein
MKLNFFSEAVIEKIGNYVYRLIDPRNKETFYVGKGRGNRVFEHVKCSIVNFDDDEDAVSSKFSRIKEIHDAGFEVDHVIHRHDLTDDAVLEVEAALIDVFPNLTNIQGGHGSGSKGPLSVEELNDKYDLPIIDFTPIEKLVLININKVEKKYDRNIVFNQTQVSWKVDLQRVKKADYVLSVVRGVVVGAFVAKKWLPATNANFPHLIPLGSDVVGRKGFFGEPASEDVWDKFVGARGKRIVIEQMKHVQFPIRYWNI